MTPWLSASIAGQVAIAAALLGGASAAQDRRPAQSGVEGPVPSRVEARAPGAVDDGPLPDQQALFDATRDNIARSESEQRFFAYKERRTELHTNPFGRMGTGPMRVYDVTPLPDGGFTRRILERDGKPVPDAEIERFDPRNRGRRRASRSQLDDALAMLTFSIQRRERVDGRPLIVVKFTPRREGKPETRAGRIARAFAGDIWVDEDLQEIVRVEATAVDDLAYGYGIVARLNAGTQVTVERREIERNLWLPVSLRFKGEGRALLFRKLVLDYAVDWFDYRRVAR